MVRQFRIVAAALAAVVLAGCGIKGPLVLPPKPPAAAAPAAPAPDPAATPPARTTGQPQPR
jgi:predicted small lipoprotein YifL